MRYNSLENPIGIETGKPTMTDYTKVALQLIRKPDRDWNTFAVTDIETGTPLLQLIRKPDRDWNFVVGISVASACFMLQLIRKPDRDWNSQVRYPHRATKRLGYNSLENPIGIETAFQ